MTELDFACPSLAGAGQRAQVRSLRLRPRGLGFETRQRGKVAKFSRAAGWTRIQHQRGARSEFASSDRTAPLVGVAMNAGYRQAFETTNEFVRIKF